ncbi:MAG: class II fructose-1,6-bisphosphate aldolase [Bacilli bacterium]
MLVNATRMLRLAKAGHYAVGHFNINNLEWIKAVLTTAQELNSPVILGVSCGAGKYMCGYKTVVAMVKAVDESLNITVPVALHLDHGTYDAAKACIEAGFTSIMFDGSALDFEDNIAKTKELVNLAHDKGLSIEAEVGAIGGTEDGVTADGELADVKQCQLITGLGIDFLAAGIGNIHGIYPEDWKGLHLDRLAEINSATGNIPLVLHGGTGIPDDQITNAIHDGISKINVNTDCQLVFAQATIDYCKAGKADPTAENESKGYDPRKLLKPGYEAIKAKVAEKMKLFGSVGKADEFFKA